MVTERDDPVPAIGLTGARFGGARRTRGAGRRSDPAGGQDAAEPVAPEQDPAADASAVGRTGARFGGATRRRRTTPPPTPPAEPAALRGTGGSEPGTRPVPLVEPAGPDEVSPYATVRPYVLTGGRTRASVGFALEALVSVAPGGDHRGGPDGVEYRWIRELCAVPRSVAEVAALLGVPLGVAQVLIADLLAVGAVTVHRTADAGGPDVALLERVLNGLYRL